MSHALVIDCNTVWFSFLLNVPLVSFRDSPANNK